MEQLLSFRTTFDEVMTSCWHTKYQQFCRDTRPTDDMIEDLQSLKRIMFAKGKRIRPFFVTSMYRQHDQHNQAIWELAVAVEWFHVFALIHDDLMDQSDERRGGDSLHAAIHKRLGSVPSTKHDAHSQALLLGDLLFSWSMALFFSAACKLEGHTEQIMYYFFQMVDEVTVGQQQDIALLHKQVQYKQILQKTKLKTASYTFTRPMHIGVAAAGNEDTQLLSNLEDLGDLLGTIFQIQDDIIDIFGNKGRANLADIRTGVPTIISEYMSHNTSSDVADQFATVFGCENKQIDDDTIKSWITDAGGLVYAKKIIASHVDQAQEIIGKLPEPIDKNFFHELLLFLQKRVS